MNGFYSVSTPSLSQGFDNASLHSWNTHASGNKGKVAQLKREMLYLQQRYELEEQLIELKEQQIEREREREEQQRERAIQHQLKLVKLQRAAAVAAATAAATTAAATAATTAAAAAASAVAATLNTTATTAAAASAATIHQPKQGMPNNNINTETADITNDATKPPAQQQVRESMLVNTSTPPPALQQAENGSPPQLLHPPHSASVVVSSSMAPTPDAAVPHEAVPPGAIPLLQASTPTPSAMPPQQQPPDSSTPMEETVPPDINCSGEQISQPATTTTEPPATIVSPAMPIAAAARDNGGSATQSKSPPLQQMIQKDKAAGVKSAESSDDEGRAKSKITTETDPTESTVKVISKSETAEITQENAAVVSDTRLITTTSEEDKSTTQQEEEEEQAPVDQEETIEPVNPITASHLLIPRASTESGEPLSSPDVATRLPRRQLRRVGLLALWKRRKKECLPGLLVDHSAPRSRWKQPRWKRSRWKPSRWKRPRWKRSRWKRSRWKRAPGSKKEVSVFALLDQGSTATFCTEELVRTLNIKGEKTPLSLATLGKQITQDTEVVTLQVQNENHSSTTTLKSAYVTPAIPVNRDNIAVPQDLEPYPHLADLDLPSVPERRVSLLIGQDNSQCFFPLEVIGGNPGEPYATRTPLGWTLHGPLETVHSDTNQANSFNL